MAGTQRVVLDREILVKGTGTGVGVGGGGDDAVDARALIVQRERALLILMCQSHPPSELSPQVQVWIVWCEETGWRWEG